MGETVSFAANGGTAQGYLAVPESGSGPGVIVIQEWWGLVGHIADVVDRFAGAGFLALAPDLYRGATAEEPDEARRLRMGLSMDQAGKDIAGAASYLAARPEHTGRGIGCVGFCFGGSLALWSATLSEDIVATVGFYPTVPWEAMSPTWSAYEEKRAMLHCDEEEGGCAAEGIRTAVTAIEGAGGKVDCFEYPGTGHAFFNDDRPEVYHPVAASEAWSRTLNLFRASLS